MYPYKDSEKADKRCQLTEEDLSHIREMFVGEIESGGIDRISGAYEYFDCWRESCAHCTKLIDGQRPRDFYRVENCYSAALIDIGIRLFEQGFIAGVTQKDA